MLTMQKNLSNTFLAILALPATALGFALSVQISALSWILTTQYGLDIHDIGLVWAAGPIAGIFGQVIIGAISDRVILGVALVVVLSLDFAINVGFNPTRSIIADVTPDGVERTKGYTWMQTVSGSFGVGAYAIGAIWDNYVLIYVAVVLVLLFSLIPPLLIEEPESLNTDEDAPVDYQPDLFADQDDLEEKNDQLDAAVDAIREQFGSDSLKRGN